MNEQTEELLRLRKLVDELVLQHQLIDLAEMARLRRWIEALEEAIS
jgi:hypothetical protein